MVIGVVNLDILVTMIHQMVINYIIILIIILFTNYNIMDNILNYKLIGISEFSHVFYSPI
jgi:ABC-type polysaccharide transport system permease subunit